MVIARPYCRYFCPYSVLLEWCSRLAWKPVKITTETCINCRLCVGVCPVDAVEIPREIPNETTRAQLFHRFVKLMFITPLLVVAFSSAGWMAGGTLLASAHPVVKTSHALQISTPATEALYPEIEASKKQRQTREDIDAQAEKVIENFRLGSAVAGGLFGLIIAMRILGLSQLRRRSEHEADRYNCIACGRCYPVCPKNLENA
jgi:ferredoxin